MKKICKFQRVVDVRRKISRAFPTLPKMTHILLRDDLEKFRARSAAGFAQQTQSIRKNQRGDDEDENHPPSYVTVSVSRISSGVLLSLRKFSQCSWGTVHSRNTVRLVLRASNSEPVTRTASLPADSMESMRTSSMSLLPNPSSSSRSCLEILFRSTARRRRILSMGMLVYLWGAFSSYSSASSLGEQSFSWVSRSLLILKKLLQRRQQ